MSLPSPESPISGPEAQAFVENYVSETDWQNRSGADIYRELRSLGVQIRTQTFYDLRRDALNIVKYQEQIQNLQPTSLIPEAWITTPRSWELEQNYLYQLEVVGEGISTEEVELRYYSFYANERLTTEEIAENILNLISEHAREYDFTVHDARVVRVFGAPERFEI